MAGQGDELSVPVTATPPSAPLVPSRPFLPAPGTEPPPMPGGLCALDASPGNPPARMQPLVQPGRPGCPSNPAAAAGGVVPSDPRLAFPARTTLLRRTMSELFRYNPIELTEGKLVADAATILRPSIIGTTELVLRFVPCSPLTGTLSVVTKVVVFLRQVPGSYPPSRCIPGLSASI